MIVNKDFSLSSKIIIIMLILLFILFIISKTHTSKRKLTLRDFTNSAIQAFFVIGEIITGINLIYFWITEKIEPPHTLIKPLHPILVAALLLIASGSWIIYENLRKLKR